MREQPQFPQPQSPINIGVSSASSYRLFAVLCKRLKWTRLIAALIGWRQAALILGTLVVVLVVEGLEAPLQAFSLDIPQQEAMYLRLVGYKINIVKPTEKPDESVSSPDGYSVLHSFNGLSSLTDLQLGFAQRGNHVFPGGLPDYCINEAVRRCFGQPDSMADFRYPARTFPVVLKVVFDTNVTTDRHVRSVGVHRRQFNEITKIVAVDNDVKPRPFSRNNSISGFSSGISGLLSNVWELSG